MGVAVAIFYTATTSLFLISFERTMLPKAYIAGGLVVYGLGVVTNYVQRKIQFSKLANGLIYFLMLSVTGLLVTYQFSDIKWLIFFLFVWNRVFVFVNGITFWSTASKIFDIQQAKRLYGLISTGEVVSSILSFFSVPLLLQFLATDQLLYIVAVAVVGCIVLMRLIVRRFSRQLSVIKETPKENAETAAADDTSSWRTFLSNPYYLLVFLLAMMPVVGLFFVDFMFAVESKNVFPDKELLAGFLGTFFGFCALLEILIKTVLYNKVISKFGLTLGISLLPITLLFSLGLAVGYGTIYGTTALFFAFIVLSRFFMSSVRKSVNEPSFQVLMQPIPGPERANVQSRIEGGPKALGNIVPGVILLILTSMPFIGTVQIAAFFLLILAGWVYLSMKVQNQYRTVLRATLEKPATGLEPMGDRADPVSAPLPDDGDAYLELAKRVAARKKSTLNYERSSFDFILKLTNSAREHDRVLAAQMLGESGRYYAFRYLMQLINDESTDVKNAALIAAGSVRSAELWPLVIAHLDSERSHEAAAYGLLGSGEGSGRDAMVRELARSFDRASGSPRLQIRLIRLIRQIGGVKATKVLRPAMQHPEAEIRDEVYEALTHLGYRVTLTERSGVAAEIDARIGLLVWVLAAQHDLENYPSDSPIQTTLESEKRKILPKIFTLLSLLPGGQRFDDLCSLLLDNNQETFGYLLEVVNMTLPESWKDKLIPLFEEQPLAEKLKRSAESYPQNQFSPDERLKDIANNHFSRISANLRATALEALAQSGADHTITLAAHAVSPEAVIAETALRALYQQNPGRYRDIRLVMKAQDDTFHLMICQKIEKTEYLTAS
ncbi:hypothetical protein GCM10007390_08970 [Persicitalea jodogahamensis]|uniref:ADP,ATP carrier protein n=2 Tax=Persicitalea jodogahamensis TaxID=402147 RepID=A0A8J3D4B9_9BACT|nr:hypothetical protein GCM10007390_08970 [Persicitalea jodogahamensis]